MKNYLSQSWDLGMAMGELSSSLILVFFVLIARNIFYKHKTKLALTIGATVFFAILIGWGVGSSFKGAGHGLSLLTPAMPFILSYHYDAYSAIGFLIGFQLIGSIIGFSLYLIYKFIIDESPKRIEVKESNLKSSITKNLLFQPLVVITLLGVSILDFTAYNTGMILNALALGSSISLILLITQNIGYIMFSPFIALAELIEGIIDKQNWKKLLLNFAIELSIQIIFILAIIACDIALLENREVR